MDIPIIFEDKYLMVINKPAGVVVNRADTTAKSETIQDFAESRVRSSSFIVHSEADQEFKDRGGIVHRLDKDTSGILVIAKTQEAFENLKNQFKDRKTVKKYLALVHGKVEPAEGVIDAPIGRNPFNRMHFGVFAGGREATTKYRVIKLIKLIKLIKGTREEFASLLDVEPKTGRTHQIRVHMKYIGHPIVSDPLYVGRKQLREDLKWCTRLFLHAKYLKITHPFLGKMMEFEAAVPSDLGQVLPKVDWV